MLPFQYITWKFTKSCSEVKDPTLIVCGTLFQYVINSSLIGHGCHCGHCAHAGHCGPGAQGDHTGQAGHVAHVAPCGHCGQPAGPCTPAGPCGQVNHACDCISHSGSTPGSLFIFVAVAM
jgi:hypothetical protein